MARARLAESVRVAEWQIGRKGETGGQGGCDWPGPGPGRGLAAPGGWIGSAACAPTLNEFEGDENGRYSI